MRYLFIAVFLLVLMPVAFAQPAGGMYKIQDTLPRPWSLRITAAEICENHIDDDNNGLADEKDFSCYFNAPMPSSCKATSIVWGCESKGGLYWADLSTGATQLAGDIHMGFLDIAWASNGKLYGMGGNPTGIWEIDPSTMTAQFIGVLPGGYYTTNAMTADALGNLYIVASNNRMHIIRLNIATWEICHVTDLTTYQVYPAGDLAFMNGYLYMSAGDNSLAKIDVRTGDVTTRRFVNQTPTGYYGMVNCGDGFLYVNERGKIYQVDPTTLAVNNNPVATMSSDKDFWIYGMATYNDGCQAPACVAKTSITSAAPQPYCISTGTELQAGICVPGSSRLIWTTPQGTNIEANTITALQPGTYFLSYIANGETCNKINSFNLVYPSKPVLKVDTTCQLPTGCVCNGKMAVTVSCGNGNYAYEWSTGATAAAVANICAGSYSVKITDIVSSTDTTIYFSLPASPAGLQDAFIVSLDDHCDQKTGGIAISNVQGGVAPYQYSLNGGAFGTVPAFSNLSKGNYVVTIKDNSGCSLQKKVTLTNISGPEKLYLSKKDAFCGIPGGTIILDSVKNGRPPYSFALDNGAYTTQSTFTGVQPGKRMIYVKDGFGCPLKDSVFIDQSEALRISVAPQDTTICASENFTLRATVLSNSADVRFVWGDNTPVTSPVYQNTVYENTALVMQAKDKNGCTATDTVFITANYCDSLFAKCVIFPNAFSPNNDRINDTFGAHIGSCNIKEFKLTIYNRWGQVIFQTTNFTHSWNGAINGVVQPAGTYLYTCVWRDAAKVLRHMKGVVVLVK